MVRRKARLAMEVDGKEKSGSPVVMPPLRAEGA